MTTQTTQDWPAAALGEDSPPRTRTTRVREGLAHPDNWLQLLRFGLVGASGYLVNLLVFALVVTGAGMDHRVGATIAFLVAVTNNFVLNRSWTFPVSERRVHHQALRFFVVSVAGFGVNLAVLEVLVVTAGLPELPAQAIAVAAAMPVNFLGNRQWTFR